MTQGMIIDLNITADDYLRHYQGKVKQVVCIARDGRRIRFPSSILQRFVSHNGIHGTFEITFDEGFKLKSFERLA